MKDIFNKLLSYSALILISSLPFPMDSYAEVEKKPESVSTVENAEKHSHIGRSHTVLEQQKELTNEA